MPRSRPRGLLALLAGLSAIATAPPLAAQVPVAEYAARRAALAEKIDSGVVIAFGGVEPVNHWPTFYQVPGFYYLTGFNETDAALVMVKRNGSVAATMFVPTRTPIQERWVGARTRPAAMERKIGIPGRDFAQLRPAIDSLATSGLPFYVVSDINSGDYAQDDTLTLGARFIGQVRQANPWLGMHQFDREVNRLRAKKSAVGAGPVAEERSRSACWPTRRR